MLHGKTIKKDSFPRMHGNELNLDWLISNETAMTEPIIVEKVDGLGMKMPPDNITVADVAEIVGPDTPVEVMGNVFFLFPPFSFAFYIQDGLCIRTFRRRSTSTRTNTLLTRSPEFVQVLRFTSESQS